MNIKSMENRVKHVHTSEDSNKRQIENIGPQAQNNQGKQTPHRGSQRKSVQTGRTSIGTSNSRRKQRKMNGSSVNPRLTDTDGKQRRIQAIARNHSTIGTGTPR